MATYVPNASDVTQPTGDKKVASAPPEFRSLKILLAGLNTQQQVLAAAIVGFEAELDALITAIGAGDNSVALAANLAASGGAGLIGTTFNGDNLQEVLDDVTQEIQTRGEFVLPATLVAFGDSFFAEPTAHTSSGHNMAYKAAALLGLTLDLTATSGYTSVDDQDQMFAVQPAVTDLFLVGLGQNDAQYIGAGSDIERRYNDLVCIQLANYFHLSTPWGSRRYAANIMSDSGVWINDTDIAEGGALVSATNASALQADVVDSRYIVIIFKIKAGSDGRFKVLIDGNEQFNPFDAAGFHSGPMGNIPTSTAHTYARCALVFDMGRRKPVSAIQVIVASATNPALTVSIHSIIGLSGDALQGPLLVSCDLSDRGAAGYATAAGSQASVPIVSRFINQNLAVVASAGGRIVPVALSTVLNPNSDLDVDEFHPNEAGANASAALIVSQIQTASKDWSTYRQDLRSISLINGANGYVMMPNLAVFMGPDGQLKRNLLSPRGIKWDGDVIPVATSLRIVFNDGTGSFNSAFALYLAREAGDTGVAYAGNIGNGDFVFLSGGSLRLRLRADGSALHPDITNVTDLGSTIRYYRRAYVQEYLQQVPVTVASLPAAAGVVGAKAWVTDATSAVFRAAVVGGGANVIPVHATAGGWLVG